MRRTTGYRMVRIADDTIVIREVQYDQRGEVLAISETDAGPRGEYVGELIDDWHRMGKALHLPVLKLKGGE